jgi:hypothetical protein
MLQSEEWMKYYQEKSNIRRSVIFDPRQLGNGPNPLVSILKHVCGSIDIPEVIMNTP